MTNSLTQVLRWPHRWNSTEALPDHVTNERLVMDLDTNFSTKGMGAQEIQAVMQAWRCGALSQDSMLDIFRCGEVLPEGQTNEEEIRLIESGKAQGNAVVA